MTLRQPSTDAKMKKIKQTATSLHSVGPSVGFTNPKPSDITMKRARAKVLFATDTSSAITTRAVNIHIIKCVHTGDT